jgi:hypothetical protein
LRRRTIAVIVVMAGLVPGIYVFLFRRQDVDGRDKPGHDEFQVGKEVRCSR